MLLEDHLFLKHVDVLFFSPTEHNMHVDPSVILINALDPEYILPQHRDTYRVTPENRFWASGYPHEVKFRLSKPLQARYHILKQGEKLPIARGASLRQSGRGIAACGRSCCGHWGRVPVLVVLVDGRPG